MTITTTLNNIRDKKPYADSWKKLLAGLGKTVADDEPLAFARILEINGIEDAVWCMRAEPQHAKDWRLFAVWCVRQIEHLITDQRSRNALDVAERHAYGLATDEELAAAGAAAWAVAMAAAGAAAWAAARGAARAAATDAARGAATDAAWDAASAATWSVVSNAARAAAWAAARDAQKAKLLEITGGK